MQQKHTRLRVREQRPAICDLLIAPGKQRPVRRPEVVQALIGLGRPRKLLSVIHVGDSWKLQVSKLFGSDTRRRAPSACASAITWTWRCAPSGPHPIEETAILDRIAVRTGPAPPLPPR